MTRILILTRHAKSSWEDPAMNDHERPLNNRGKRAARALGNWFHSKGWHPDQVLSSDSERTKETFVGLALDTEAVFTSNLYHATANQMLRTLSQATGEVVLMLGHNPGIAAFAAELASEPPDHTRFFDYPSGATAIIRFDIESWDQVAWRGGEVMDFIVPRDLPET